MSDRATWQQRRREAVTALAAADDRRRAREIERARAMLADFVAQCRAAGAPPTPLRARVPGRRATYRTGLTGWYLRANRSLAVGEDGSFYILDVPPSLASRIRGVTVEPSDPPLVVGRGARDGETIELAELLQRARDAVHQPK